MRASVLVWSTASGLILGLFVDAVLVAVWMLATTVLPMVAWRAVPRCAATVAMAGLTVILLIGAVLGFLEGQLKAP